MEIARELDVPIEPKLQSHSPSSVSEVDSSGDNFHLSKRQKVSCDNVIMKLPSHNMIVLAT